MKNLGFFVTFDMNLHTQSRSQAKKTSAPAPEKCCRSTGILFIINKSLKIAFLFLRNVKMDFLPQVQASEVAGSEKRKRCF
jgi:hypothetical protein